MTLSPVAGPAGNVRGQDDQKNQAAVQENIKKLIAFLPVQKTDIDVDTPSAEELEGCKLEKTDNPLTYVVRDSSGRVVRKFSARGGSTRLDQLSYFKNGMEVYRDLDTKGSGKLNEFRWLGSAGTRWGVDLDGDSKIDQWKRISAEEVTQELFQAIKTKDKARFEALLITPDEFKSLKLGETLGKEVNTRWQKAQSDFVKFCNAQKEIDSGAEFVHASNGLPSVLAAQSYENQADVMYYDHASAVFQNKSREYGNLSIGTIVYVGEDRWRLIELPEIAAVGTPIANGGALIPTMTSGPAATPATDSVNRELAEIHENLDAIETKLQAAKQPTEIARLEKQKSELQEKLFWASEAGEYRQTTLMYVTDSVISAYQEDRYPEALKFLEDFQVKLKAKGEEGTDYIHWRTINGRYNYVNLKGDSKDRDKAHERWVADLMDFQKEFPKSSYAAEALSYLAVNFDNEGKEKEAIDWYKKTVERFADTEYGQRAKGALSRLDGQGKTLTFVGQDLRGNKFNLQDPRWRDKIIVIHYWATWSTDGLDQIQKLVDKYKDDVVFVGCNIESTTEEFEGFIKNKPEYNAWTQLHAPGSIDSSPLALQLGVPSLPLVVIVNKKGELAEPMVVISDLDRQIERQRRRE